MIIEQKAKAYDEALERARKSLRAASNVGTDIVTFIFPELAESEDERIRKKIIELIGYFRSRGVDQQLCEKCLAYLEKQRDKERLDRMAPIYNDKESFESALEKAWKYYNESSSRTVDSFEDNYIECVFSKGFREGFLYKEDQKPVEYLDKDKIYAIMKKLHDISFSKDILINSKEYKQIGEITADVRSLLDYPIEQKSAEWSEEDEHIVGDTIYFLDTAKKHYASTVALDACIDWLKSLPERFNLEPKQEWTDDDESI